MNNVQDIIDKISKGEFTEGELSQYLDSSLVLIKSNAIMAIIRLKITENNILDKLYEISSRANEESKVIGLWTNGHLAMAALSLLNTRKSRELFKNSINQLDVNTQRDIERLIEQLPEIM